MEKYLDFAYMYDRLTYDVDYKKTADYIEKIFEKYCARKPSLIADLACGTGSMCVELSNRGYDMIGIDFSENMLDVASKKKAKNDILYLNQDITEFELYGTVDVILCLLDSVNHITDKDDLKKMFLLASNYLNPGGIIIFDINTKYKFENVLADNIFTYDSDDIFYVWENDYSADEKLCDFYLTFFAEQNGLYKRVDECHTERCYSEDEIEEIVNSSKFKVLDKYDNLSFDKPKHNSERIFYVARSTDKKENLR